MTLALFLPLLAQSQTATQTADPVAPDDEVVVTATLLPPRAEEIASATLLPQRTIDALSPPLVSELLRLAPGVSVSTSGAPGSQTQVRIRGAEANHTLLFVDGIQLNDVSGGNEARFETLATDGVGRIEFVRGPQSALYGSEALGGVLALSTPTTAVPAGEGLFELGSHGNRRAAARASVAGVSVGGSLQSSRGIDVLGGGTGDRDGYENRTAYLSARGPVLGELTGQLAARYIDHDVEFDGTDPLTFRRADTTDATRTRTGALRGALAYGGETGFAGGVDAQYLRSSARNRNAAAALNRTRGERLRFGGDARYMFAGLLGTGDLSAIARVEHEEEDFVARDQAFGGGTDQDRSRRRTAVVGQVRGQFGPVVADVAVRHDAFNRFEDATTVRAGALVEVADGLTVAGSYGEGIAQPTFFDLFGFFPGSFRGNPDLRPERSRGYEFSLRYEGARAQASVTGFSNRLRDEIVGVRVDPVRFIGSTANASGRSRRRGVEVAGELRPLPGLRVAANYTYLDANDQRDAGVLRLREIRRPKHSGNLYSDFETGPVTLGAAASYVGRRRDSDFNSFPAPRVTLDDYVLLSARAEYRIADKIGLFVRGENLANSDFEDAVGYETPGRGVHAGIRFRLR